METPSRYRPEPADNTPYQRIVHTLDDHHGSPTETSAPEPRGPLSPTSRRSPATAPYRGPEEPAYQLKPFTPQWRFVGEILSYIVVLSEESVATCNYSPYQRAMNPDAHGTALVSAAVRRFVFVYGVRLVQLLYCGILLALLPQFRRSLFWSFGIIFGLYFLGEFVSESLKRVSGDMNCHTKHPNGVSGHYFFILYNFWTTIYLGKLLRRSVTYSPYIPLVRLLSLFILLCCLGLEGFFSYYYGYHSVKQIVYGALVGKVFAAGAIAASEFALANDWGRYLKSE